jgi:MFS family permease
VNRGVPLGRWRAATLIAYAIGGVVAATWGPRLPDLTRELHVTTGEIGGMLAVANVGLLVGLVLAASLARALGARRTVAAALVVVVLSLAGSAAAIAVGSVPLVVVAWIVLGLSSGVLDVLINAEGAGIEQRGGRSFLPLLHALWLGGAAVGAAIGALCAAVGVTIATQAAALAVLVAVAGIAVVRLLPGSAAAEGAAALAAERAVEAGPFALRLRSRLRIWADPRLIALGVLIFGVELAEGSARTWIPLAVERGSDQPDAVAALFVTIFSVTTGGFRALGGPVVDRLGRVVVVRATIAVGAVGVALFVLGPGLGFALAGTLLWAVGNCVAGPLAMSAAAEGGGDAAARLGVVTTIGFAAGLAGPPLIGLLAQQVGVIPSFWALAIAFAVAFALTGALRSRAAEPATR